MAIIILNKNIQKKKMRKCHMNLQMHMQLQYILITCLVTCEVYYTSYTQTISSQLCYMPVFCNSIQSSCFLLRKCFSFLSLRWIKSSQIYYIAWSSINTHTIQSFTQCTHSSVNQTIATPSPPLPHCLLRFSRRASRSASASLTPAACGCCFSAVLVPKLVPALGMSGRKIA